MTNKSRSAWPAPAKLNLFLHVTGQRSDGYHELQTLFQLLDWGDEVSIEPLDESGITRPRASYAVREADDLVIRAAVLLQAETSCRQGARIEVKKRIPVGGGLGGWGRDRDRPTKVRPPSSAIPRWWRSSEEERFPGLRWTAPN